MSIGQSLAAARRDAGLSIDDLSAKTRLRATVIRAIENDDFSLCGGDFYARGHIRTLAGISGADAAALLAEYDATVAQPDDAPVQLAEAEVGAHAITKHTMRRGPNWFAAGAAMVLVVVIVFAAAKLIGGPHSPTPPRAEGATTASSAPASAPAAPSTSGPSAVASQPVAPPASAPTSAVAEVGVHVVLRITTAKCWVLASASDGRELFQGVLNPGDNQTFDDPQKVSLRLGNAPATDLTVNGVDIGAPASKSNVVSVSFGPGNPATAQG